ncbi:rab2 family gtpase [Phytophthora cinnamomi]|uniref:rab2 family gtpase n=1 Tax=Phytophthora cinnamomi TaxID=4785 RepID=UPI003559B65D|nr:rab2 family gtpase [Phytophthora cinnamomi]
MMAPPFAAAPSASLVVRRDKRRRRKAADPSDTGRRPRRGFKFSDKKDEDAAEAPVEATPVGKRKPGTPAKDNTFVFRVRKDDEKDVGKQHAVDAAAASAALRAKQEKAARAEMRRLVRQKKREEATREALNEEEMKHKKLSADQVSLYHMVQRQVKRELRKVRKEFLTSAARRDIMQLSETSLQAMKQELISFMAEHPPGNVAIKVPNPENARMRATIETYEERIKGLEEEEKKWLDMKATLEADRSSAQSEAESDATRGESETGTDEQQEKLPCELKVTQSVEVLQRSALQQLGSTTEQLTLLDASMLTVNRLIVEAEMKKAKLFGAYHDSAFKGYGNVAQPKESLRALLTLPPRGGVP